MMQLFYWLVVAIFAGLTVCTMYREKRPLLQVSSAMVLVVLLLRLFGVK